MRLESGEDTVVGVNKFTSTEPSPLQAEGADSIFVVDKEVEERAREAVAAWRADRDPGPVKSALERLTEAAARRENDSTENLMDATLECARAGVTTGEWSGALREVFGSYRAPTGVTAASSSGSAAPGERGHDGEPDDLEAVRQRVRRTADELGVAALRMLVGKPGLDGHSNGAEQIAVRARDAGFEVIYQGIRLTPAEIVAAAVQEGVHVVGLSILSGSHLEVVPAVLDGLARADAADIPVVVGGIIPPKDAEQLERLGVQRVVTPKSYSLTGIMGEFVDVIREVHGLEHDPTPTGV
jgi:(2R)-ethylmalonyl-CoA mutase